MVLQEAVAFLEALVCPLNIKHKFNRFCFLLCGFGSVKFGSWPVVTESLKYLPLRWGQGCQKPSGGLEVRFPSWQAGPRMHLLSDKNMHWGGYPAVVETTGITLLCFISSISYLTRVMPNITN